MLSYILPFGTAKWISAGGGDGLDFSADISDTGYFFSKPSKQNNVVPSTRFEFNFLNQASIFGADEGLKIISKIYFRNPVFPERKTCTQDSETREKHDERGSSRFGRKRVRLSGM